MWTPSEVKTIASLREERRALLSWFGEHADLNLQRTRLFDANTRRLFRVSWSLYQMTGHPPYKPALRK